jgi:hypothetical protein
MSSAVAGMSHARRAGDTMDEANHVVSIAANTPISFREHLNTVQYAPKNLHHAVRIEANACKK